MGAAVRPEQQQGVDPLIAEFDSLKKAKAPAAPDTGADPLIAEYDSIRAAQRPPATPIVGTPHDEDDVAPQDQAELERNAPRLRRAASGVPAAPIDATRTGAAPETGTNLDILVKHLRGELQPAPAPPTSLAGRTLYAAGSMAAHPAETAAMVATAPFQAAYTLGQFSRQELEKAAAPAAPPAADIVTPGKDVVSKREAAFAAGQLLVPGAASKALPYLETVFGAKMAQAAVDAVNEGKNPGQALLTGWAARTGLHAAADAAIGAVYSPNDPAMGALLGAALGGAHAASEAPSVRIPVRDEPTGPVADVSTQIGKGPKGPLQGTATILRTPPATPGPDYTVESPAGNSAAPMPAAEPDYLKDWDERQMGPKPTREEHELWKKRVIDSFLDVRARDLAASPREVTPPEAAAPAAPPAPAPKSPMNSPEEIAARDVAPGSTPPEPGPRKFPATASAIADLATQRGITADEAGSRLAAAGYDVPEAALAQARASIAPPSTATPAAPIPAVPAPESAPAADPLIKEFQASQPVDRKALDTYASSLRQDGTVNDVRLIGSRANGKATPASDTDVLYDLTDKLTLPADQGDAASAVQRYVEQHPFNFDQPVDHFFQVGDRYFHLATGAGRDIVENSDYGREQAKKSSVSLGEEAPARPKGSVITDAMVKRAAEPATPPEEAEFIRQDAAIEDRASAASLGQAGTAKDYVDKALDAGWRVKRKGAKVSLERGLEQRPLTNPAAADYALVAQRRRADAISQTEEPEPEPSKPEPKTLKNPAPAEQTTEPAPATEGEVPKRNRFADLYEQELRAEVTKNPQDFKYGVDEVPRIVDKMTKSIAEKNANIRGSKALQRVARQLGIKFNMSEMAKAAAEAPATAKQLEAPAKKPVTPQVPPPYAYGLPKFVGAPHAQPEIKRATAEPDLNPKNRYVPTGVDLEDAANSPSITDVDTPLVKAARIYTAEQGATIDRPNRTTIQTDAADAEMATLSQFRGRGEIGMVIGLPGSGKTSIAAQPLAAHLSAGISDVDNVKSRLPEYERGWGSEVVYQEAGKITKGVRARLQAEHVSYVHPGLGANTDAILKELDALHEKGYQVHLVRVSVSPAKARERAVSRFEDGGHFVRPEYVDYVGTKDAETYNRAKTHPAVASYALIDNDGDTPVIVEQHGAGWLAGSGLDEATGRGGRGQPPVASAEGAKASEVATQPSAEAPPKRQLERPAAQKIQRLAAEAETPASPEDISKLVDAGVTAIKEGGFPNGSKALRTWAETVLGRPYSAGTWHVDDVYDALEGAVNAWYSDITGGLGTGTAESKFRDQVKLAKQIEDRYFTGRLRSAGIMERQQFSTPLPIAIATAYSLGVLRGEKILEPTAGTGNLIIPLATAGVTIRANEIDPRRAAVLKAIGFEPTSDDALRIPLDGTRYNAVAMNPPYGSYRTGKYAGQGALPFKDGDVSQRFVAAALASLIDGGRLAAVMPPNTLGQAGAAFRKWLAENHRPMAYILSPEGAYEGRGTGIATVLMVIDKGPRAGARSTEPLMVTEAPTWEDWITHVEQLAGGGRLRRTEAHEPAQDVAATKQRRLVSPSAPATTSEEVPSGPPRELGPDAGRDVDARSGEQPAGRRLPATGPDESAGGPGHRLESGAERPADVVAGQPSGPRAADVDDESAADLVPQLSRGRVESTAGDSEERRSEIAAANDSAVFAPYVVGIGERRAPHPRLVVETRAMAGMPAPPIRTKPQSPAVEAAWGRDGAKGGISDEQLDAILRTTTAWKQGHGFLVSDDVGVGKSREAAGAALEALAQGAKRLLYITKNETNLIDAQREFRAVASGAEDGEFPAMFVTVGEYPQVKKGEDSLPMPDDRPVVYLAHSYNFRDFADALQEVKLDTLLADEAHEFKNVFADRRMAWQALHAQMLQNPAARFAYYTATPGVSLDELGYLFGLREWPVGGFSDWVDRKLGHSVKEDQEGNADASTKAHTLERDKMRTLGEAGMDALADDDSDIKKGKRRFMRGAPDVFAMKVTPAETEQVMRELKGSGKYISRDLWRGGVKFNVDTVDLTGAGDEATAARARYDKAAEFVRDLTIAAQKFGRMNQKVKTAGLDRALIQSYMKQLLFDLRFPKVLRRADEALKAGKQVVISVNTVAGDAALDEGISAADAEVPLNKRLESAINRINTQEVKKEGQGDSAEWVDLGEIPEALQAVAGLRDRLATLQPLQDPIRTIEDRFGKKNVAAITGKVSGKKRKQLMSEFQAGQRKVAVISRAGKVGISLHDVNGKRRRMLVADYEWSADTFKQELGRVDRTGQRSNPEVTLLASNIAGERKFAATIAARMASLGATSKGSAEATGTDALDQFDVADSISLAAMKMTVEQLFGTPLRDYLTGSKWYEWKKDQETNSWERFPKRRPDQVSIRDFLLDLMMFPVKAADEVWAMWNANRDGLISGESVQAAQSKRTGRLHGEITRTTDLNKKGEPALTMYEVKNAEGERRGILQGFVTHYINRIQGARGLDEHGGTKTRRYIQFTAPTGLVSGLEVTPAEIRRIKEDFGRGGRTMITPKAAWDDLAAGERVKVNGPDNVEWTLRQRQDGKIAIQGATLSKHGKLLNGLAQYSTVGNLLYLPNERAAFDKFVTRFPLKQPTGKAKTKPTSTAGGADVELAAIADPFTAMYQMYKQAQALRRRRMGLPPAAETSVLDPAIKRLTGSAAELRDIFNPAGASDEAGQASRIIRAGRGEMDMDLARARQSIEDVRDALDSLSPGKNFDGPRWDWYRDMEAGRLDQIHGPLQGVAHVFRKLLDDTRDEIQALGPGHLDSVIENYMPRIYGEGPKIKSAAHERGTRMGKRPFQPKNFKKQRAFETLDDAIAAGYKPISDNPIDMLLLKLREMRKYLMAQRIKEEMKATGLVKFTKKLPPDGWSTIDDNAFTVFAPRDAEGAQRIRGRYIAPSEVARIVNNFLSPGLRGRSDLYDSYNWLGNMLNMAQLGMSAFHAGFVAFDATVQTAAIGLDQLMTGAGKGGRLAGAGKLLIAGASAATGPLSVIPLPAAVLSYLRGSKVWHAYLNDSSSAEMQRMLTALTQGGGRAKMDDYYRAGNVEKFRSALRDHRWGSTILHAPFAAIEGSMYPLLEHVVPRMKLGAIEMMMDVELSKLPPGATDDQVRKVAAKVVDAVDARLGQMIYDNRFWHRATKEIMMAGIRSVGWDVGTFDVTLGGAAQAAGNVRRLVAPGAKATEPRWVGPAGGATGHWEYPATEPPEWHKVQYLAALAGVVALYGAIYTYLHTGDSPKGKDFYFPRTGKLDRDGNPERIQPATYVKDIFSIARHPVDAVLHKIHPLLQETAEALQNRDFYGNQIRNPDDPGVVQLRQIVDHIIQSATPLSIRNASELTKRGITDPFAEEKVQGFFGNQAAPREVVKTTAQNKMNEILARRGQPVRTPEEQTARQGRQDVLGDVRSGDVKRDSLRRLVRAGELTPGQAQNMASASRENALVTRFKMLTPEEARTVYDLGTPEEQDLWDKVLKSKERRNRLRRPMAVPPA